MGRGELQVTCSQSHGNGVFMSVLMVLHLQVFWTELLYSFKQVKVAFLLIPFLEISESVIILLEGNNNNREGYYFHSYEINALQTERQPKVTGKFNRQLDWMGCQGSKNKAASGTHFQTV